MNKILKVIGKFLTGIVKFLWENLFIIMAFISLSIGINSKDFSHQSYYFLVGFLFMIARGIEVIIKILGELWDKQSDSNAAIAKILSTLIDIIAPNIKEKEEK